MFSGTVLAAFLARTAALTQLEATGHGSRQAEELHALLERRAFLAMLTARLMPGGPRHGPSRRRRRCSHRGTCVRRGDGHAARSSRPFGRSLVVVAGRAGAGDLSGYTGRPRLVRPSI